MRFCWELLWQASARSHSLYLRCHWVRKCDSEPPPRVPRGEARCDAPRPKRPPLAPWETATNFVLRSMKLVPHWCTSTRCCDYRLWVREGGKQRQNGNIRDLVGDWALPLSVSLSDGIPDPISQASVRSRLPSHRARATATTTAADRFPIITF